MDDLSLPPAPAARLHAHELSEGGTLADALLAGAAAARTERRSGTTRPGGATVVAGLEQAHPQALVDSARDLRQREGKTQANALPSPAGGGAGRATAEKVAERASASEVPHEDLDRVREVEAAEAASSLAAVKSLLPVAVVELLLLRIAQNLVRAGDLLEALLRLQRTLVAIGMVLHRQTPVGFPYLLHVRAPGNAQGLVVVCHSDPALSAECRSRVKKCSPPG